MPRFLLAALAAVLLLAPTTADGHSGLRLRGTVALKSEANDLVTVRAQRNAFALRVPGSLERIRIGQRVELRGSTLRARGNGSRVLARNVSIVSFQPLSTDPLPRMGDGEADDDEIEIKGTIRSLSPLTVVSTTRSVTCAVRAGTSLGGFAVDDFVEITCDLIGGTWTLRVLKHEDRDDDEDEDDDSSGPGSDDDDDDEDEDHSGPGGGGDDDD